MKNISSTSFLKNEFEARKKRNSLYSVRAFARDIGVSKSTVFDVLNGVRKLSEHHIDVVAKNMLLPQEIIDALKADYLIVSDFPRDTLEDDDMVLLEDWQYLAILNLAKLPNAKYCPEWIAERLAIPLNVAQSSLDLLANRNMIKNEAGNLIRLSKLLTTTVDIPSASIREHHRQSIERSLIALDTIPVEDRDFTTVTYAIAKNQIGEFKEHILNFHRKIGKKIETDQPDSVYRLNIQLFPLSTLENSHD